MQCCIFPIFLYNALYVWFVLFSRHSLYLGVFVFNYPIVSSCTKFVFQKRYELEVIYILFLPWPKERFRFPKTIEIEELCVERAVPKSNRYRNKWAVGIFEDWQQVRSVKFPIVEVGEVFKEYELDKVQPLTRPITEMDALTLNYWLSKLVQEVAKCSKDPYPPKIRCTRLSTAFADSWWKRTQPSSSVPSTLQTNVAWIVVIGEGGRSLFLIRFAIFRRILDAEMKDGTRAGVCLKVKKEMYCKL